MINENQFLFLNHFLYFYIHNLNSTKNKKMKKTNQFIILAFLFIVGSAFLVVDLQTWKITDNYSIQFESKDPSGIFREFKGEIKFSKENPEKSSFNLTIPVKSISTGNAVKNKKSLSGDWFDEKNHPLIQYKSSSVQKTDKGYLIIGQLTIKGVSKTYKVPLTFEEMSSGAIFSGKFDVNRLDFKVGESSKRNPDVMHVTYKVPVVKI